MTTSSEGILRQDYCCPHCGEPVSAADTYCCSGCYQASRLIADLGLGTYYLRRQFDPARRRPRPDEGRRLHDVSAWIRDCGDGMSKLTLLVDGLHCGACVWLIEQTLLRQGGIVSARVSLSTRRLSLSWKTADLDATQLIELVQKLGYDLVPLDPDCLRSRDDAELRALLRAMAVAGFAAGNLMLLSVSVWSGFAGDMGAGTRDFLHWISALIAIPAVSYAGQPFFRSAWHVLRTGKTNMDVPISLAIVLAPGISLYETFTGGEHAYFDSAATLLFFLLIGRYLDLHARRAARASAEQLLALNATSATVIQADGSLRELPPRDLQPGQSLLVRPGCRVPADGIVVQGDSELDVSLISGETVPARSQPGATVFAGTLNLTAPLTVRIDKVGDDTLLADIMRLMEAAEARRNRFVRLADRVARHYAPVVHLTALATFLGWLYLGHLPWQEALMIAIAVLIITCPCALALAVPVVQVVASHRLLRAGILLKSADALERLKDVDHIVFDKTGTLTLGRLDLRPGSSPAALAVAAVIAANSRHPLAQALVKANGHVVPASGVTEIPGKGLEWQAPEGIWRLGSAAFTGQTDDQSRDQSLWLVDPQGHADCFRLTDPLRPDAVPTVTRLRSTGEVEICSGDRPAPVSTLASRLGITQWRAAQSPADKVAHLEMLRAQGRHVLMIGDGLNDAPALSAAHVSIAPANGAEISQNAADLVFQGDRLEPVELVLRIARQSDALMRQNLALALLYNLAAVPLAISGYVTPLIAALAMSSSSILVVANSLRLNRLERRRSEPAATSKADTASHPFTALPDSR